MDKSILVWSDNTLPSTGMPPVLTNSLGKNETVGLELKAECDGWDYTIYQKRINDPHVFCLTICGLSNYYVNSKGQATEKYSIAHEGTLAECKFMAEKIVKHGRES